MTKHNTFLCLYLHQVAKDLPKSTMICYFKHQDSFNGASRKHLESFKRASRELQESFKRASREL